MKNVALVTVVILFVLFMLSRPPSSNATIDPKSAEVTHLAPVSVKATSPPPFPIQNDNSPSESPAPSVPERINQTLVNIENTQPYNEDHNYLFVKGKLEFFVGTMADVVEAFDGSVLMPGDPSYDDILAMISAKGEEREGLREARANGMGWEYEWDHHIRSLNGESFRKGESHFVTRRFGFYKPESSEGIYLYYREQPFLYEYKYQDRIDSSDESISSHIREHYPPSAASSELEGVYRSVSGGAGDVRCTGNTCWVLGEHNAKMTLAFQRKLENLYPQCDIIAARPEDGAKLERIFCHTPLF